MRKSIPSGATVTTCHACLVFRALWEHGELFKRLLERELRQRYRGSFLGVFWSFLSPLLLLLVFTFVFSVIFESRWATGPTEETPAFSLVLFAGLLVYFFFAECMSAAPGLILGKVSYVKQVVFPLEVLPAVTVTAAGVQMLIGFAILLVAQVFLQGAPAWTVLLLPLVLLPLILFLLGLSWFIASLGVYIRDVAQAMPLFVQLMMFISCVFYPLSALPEWMQPWMFLNPLVAIIDQTRGVLFYARPPDPMGYGIILLLSLVTAWAGAWWFARTRKGFADVL